MLGLFGKRGARGEAGRAAIGYWSRTQSRPAAPLFGEKLCGAASMGAAPDCCVAALVARRFDGAVAHAVTVKKYKKWDAAS